MNMVRSMLSEKQMPKEFWVEAANWSIHILNRCPTTALENMTPQEAWTGCKPRVDHFQIFGCLAHVHVPDQKRIKLDEKSKTHIFLGVRKESKAYKLFDPITKKITISKDVKFEENACWKWEQSKGEAQSDVLDWEDKNSDANKELELEEDSDSNTSNTISQTGGNSSATSSGGSEPNSPTCRSRRAPTWMSEYTTREGLSEEEETMMVITEEDPVTYNEAAKEKKWRDAMAKEIDSIEKNGTWRLTTLPNGVKAIGVKWVFKTKLNEHGNVEKYKARLVAKGYAQQYGIDYT